jgi:SAM-dependent methyltransferase
MVGWFSSPLGPTFRELARQGLSSVEGGYDLLAEKFDASVFRTPDAVLDGLQAVLPGRVRCSLDIGCGTGAMLERLQAISDQCVGIDLSRNMLQKAARVVPGAELWHTDFLQTYWEDRFDLITSVGVMGHIPPPRQREFFRRLRAALRPGGVYLSVVGDLRRRPWVYLPAWVFDSAMRVRNQLWRPRFVMYYLSFVLPQAAQTVQAAGLQVEVLPGHFPAPFSQLQILRATRPYPN